MISRRNFLRIGSGLGLSALLPATSSCEKTHTITGKITGANAALGHRLRTMDFGPVTETIKTDILIVGGGIAGLSAARYLKKHTDAFLLLELESEVGGNAIGGNNSITSFPWGAHYLPLPGNSDPELLAFLQEATVITGIRNGLPVYNEYHLCHDPKERLFIHNFWQEGIVPHEGVPKKDREEIQRFLEWMHTFKEKVGNDHKPAFTIPLEQSSQDPELLALDLITAEDFLNTHGFQSSYLKWYVRYCCADDYGTSLRQTSAWAMIHYYASRKGKAFNASSDAVLTWPEGNFWLVKQLKKQVADHIVPNSLAYSLTINGDHVECLFFDPSTNTSKKAEAKVVVMATPQFINQRILHNVPRDLDYTVFQYAPWMVANITTTHPLHERRGEGLCWDNVIYGSDSLGYVNATHQQIGFHGNTNVITYYKPLLDDDASSARKQAHQRPFDDWKTEILSDLKKPHTEIEKYIQEMNVWLWGHGMIRPRQGFIWREDRHRVSMPVKKKIHFAHSDLSGISVFEEAFYQGHKAAKAILEA